MLHQQFQHRPIRPSRADWAVGTIALLHVLIALIFLVILSIAVDRAEAREAACPGDNLLDRLAVEAPDALSDLRAAADRIPNGTGLLWRVEADGVPPSWLFGTMHVSDPRVVEMSPAARSAFEASETVVLELQNMENASQMQAAILANPALTMLADGATLQSLLSGDQLQQVEAALDQRGIPLALVSRMQPWMVFTMMIVPECEMERRSRGLQALDMQLAQQAASGGKQLEGLETITEQLSVFVDMPLDLQVEILTQVAGAGPYFDDFMTTMTDLYLAGEIGMIRPMMELSLADISEEDRNAYAEFDRRLVETRNHVMVDRVQPVLEQGNAFVAVGALHLPGEEGLVDLLRDRGYRVTAVP